VDMAGGKVYWAEQTGTNSGRIRRANLNGTNVQLVRALTSRSRRAIGAVESAVRISMVQTSSWLKN
jgi:hypothetical protein